MVQKTRIRTVDFLPEIFRTATNEQFLSATLDQLTQDPKLKPTQGFIGRRVGPGVNPQDSYVLEPSKTRTDYQLEPGVVFLKPNTNTVETAVTYPGLVDSIKFKGGNTTRQDRLWESEYYSWDPFVDLDKFVNFSQYYWLPGGPDYVDVFASPVPITDNFQVTRGTNEYTFSGVAGTNPQITLVRQGSYTFDVQQNGHKFWIQAVPGVSGVMPQTPNQSSREVLGVVNNGDDNGTITFNVPAKSDQNFYYQLTDGGQVDFATDIPFDEINNIYYSQFIEKYGGIDGVTDIAGRKLIFLGDSGWFYTGLFDSPGQPYDTAPYDETLEITLNSQKYSVWQINLVYDDPLNPYIKLTVDHSVDPLTKLLILYGTQYSNISFYKNASGAFERIPLITADRDILYYQDADNPAMFGVIRLIDAPTDVDIIVEEDYIPEVTLQNSVIRGNILTFSASLGGSLLPGMVLSGGQVTEGTYLVSGSGNTWLLNQEAQGAPTTAKVVNIIGAKNYTSPNGVTFTNGLKVRFEGPTIPSSYSGNQYYVEGVGSAIQLLPVTDFITPENYTRSGTIPYDSTPYDSTPYDESLNAPIDQDYMTINRASQDHNAWSRSNRWFHVDVINASAQYNNQVPFLDNNQRAKRPILEFIPNLKLINFGTVGLQPVNIIDFRATDAMSNINGSIGYSVDGYALQNGSRVIFAADRDPEVRNKIYSVTLITPSGSGTPVIDLQPADLNSPDVEYNQCVVVISGITEQGKSYWFNGITWQPSQQKTNVNQPPLFDVYDTNGVSFSDPLVYPGTSFAGTKLFSYAPGEGVTDKVVGQPLKYLTINNVGDIVFDNNLYIDNFVYVQDTVSVEVPISSGFVREYVDRTEYENLIGWQTAYTTVVSRQSFSFTYNGDPLVLDIPVKVDSVAVPIKVFVNADFITPDNYTYEIKPNNSTVITFVNAPAVGSSIEVTVISDVASPTAFYTVPLNLENNPLNDQVTEVTLGTVRNYYDSACQNLKAFQGTINGQNNTRDLGNIIPYGDTIIQNSAPVTLAALFANNTEYDFFNSIEYASGQYQKFKDLLMDAVVKSDFQNMTTAQILDECVTVINYSKTDQSPFFWSDMLPTGETYKETVYTVTPISSNVFDTLFTYDFAAANYQAVLVYLNDQLLLGNGVEYEVATDGARVTILVPLALGDVVTIREYENTAGNYVPMTPTKMGLYPTYLPERYIDTTYVTPTEVIRGHDGSITVAYGDIRDDVLLEFEKRIYDNLKLQGLTVPLTYADVAPGQFRKTDYTQAEITNIMGTSFLAWVGANKLDYKAQDYIPTNSWTWNYSSSSNKLNDKPLLGAWRGIYNYFYDTDAPNTRPWEMLGFSEEPSWWQDEYGPAPYTSGNMVLWDDLEAGRVMDPAGPYILTQYARPGLSKVVPSGSEGELLPPIDIMVGDYDQGSFRKSWTVGDDGPVENAWRTSSAWPFAVQRLLALTKPAQYFTYYADRDIFRFSPTLKQWVYFDRSRSPDLGLVTVYGQGEAKHGYVNWIIDFNKRIGKDSTVVLGEQLIWTDVRLCYRMASFSDKQYIKIYTEKSSPNSLNTSLLLPDESYQLLLYQNPTVSALTWSSVIIQKTELGYAVYGYSTTKPYFDIVASIPNGNYRTITVADTVVRAPLDFSDIVVQVPYGYEFIGVSSVVDFLLSYGNFMERQGMTFLDQDRGRILNWSQMAQEFMYWAQQGWAPGSLININPAANTLNVFKQNLVAEPLSVTAPEDVLLNQNKQALQTQDFVVERFANDLTLRAVNNNTFSYLNAKFTQFENLIVFDNKSVFNDLIYNPTTGARQSRLLFVGYTTYDWNGTLDAQGFILNQDNVPEWVPNKSYSKGQIVKYKDAYWSAVKIIPPQEKFDFQYWLKSDYAQIQKGLLPNAATNDEQIRNFYDVNAANLERDADLFSYGLIGFRPRRYMQNLNLDDISQVNLYKSFIGVKGTTQATDLFTRANLGKEVAEYEIFENWAIQRAVYGANANRSYFELRLNEALLLGNPSTIQIINPGEFSTANQTVLVDEIWKESYKITSPDILPTTVLTKTDITLPSAGYVNWDDADYKVFDFNELNNIIPDITNVQVGTSIWVAKDNSYDWNIYRTNLVLYSITQVRDNLNGTCTVTFAGQHGLTANNKIVIKYFGEGVDGSYTVLSVPSLKTITIQLTLGGAITTINSTGLCFVLESMRVPQAADVVNLEYANRLLPGSQAWVDDDGTGHWVVYKKVDPFTTSVSVTPQEPIEYSRFGTSISQGFSNLGALIGAPGYNNGVGEVYGFGKDENGNYVEIERLIMSTTNFQGYGLAVDTGNQQWGIAGAPESWSNQGYAVAINRDPTTGAYIQTQLLSEVPHNFYQVLGDGSTTSFLPTGVTITDPAKMGVVVDDVVLAYGTDWTISSPNVILSTPPTVGAVVNIFNFDEYGYSVTISNDERWMYIGCPSANRFYIYNKIVVQSQVKNFTGDSSTTSFYIADTIIVDDDSTSGGIGSQQIGVTVNNIAKTANVDYTYVDGSVVFTAPPNTGDKIRVIRSLSKLFVPSVPTTTFLIEDLYVATDINAISVYVNQVLQRPNMDYTYNSLTKTVTFVSGAVTGTILITTPTHWQPVGYFDMPTPVTGARFGHSITTTSDGRQILTGTPVATVDTKVGAGETYMIDRSVERFTVTDPTQTQYSTLRNFNGPATVKVNATFLVPDAFNNDGQFSEVNSNTVNITVPLNVGDIIEIETNEFKLVQVISSNSPHEGSNFGKAIDMCPTNCSLYIAQPNDSTVLPEAGSVERFVNQNRLYGTITGNVQDPTLTPGDTLRINNVDIAVPTPATWNNAISYTAGSFVKNGSDIYKAKIAVPVGTAITDDIYWADSSWVELYANTINEAAAPNNVGLVEIPNVAASVTNNYLTISIQNSDAAIPFSQLILLPGQGNAFYDIGFTPMVYTQTIQAPGQIAYSHFGASLSISDDSLTLAVGAPQGTAFKATTFDGGDTYFDSKATEYFDPLSESGVVYTYDLLAAANGSIYNPSKFVFGAQIYDETLRSLDEFGTAVSLKNGVLLVGAPQDDLDDSVGDFGRVAQLNNPNKSPAWLPIYRQQPIVDVYLLNSIFCYDRLESKVTQYFDFIDPLQGKILGAARQNIDYISSNDPAAYNTGPVNNYGDQWNESHLGEIWWDLSTTRFIDYHQSTLQYASRRWGQLFPGSSVDVYQWIESDVPPADYAGPGTVYRTDSYVVTSKLTVEGLFATRYLYWVKGIPEVASRLKKTLSAQAIAQYIENPRSSGIPYVAALSSSALALYNARPYISAQDTILQVEFDKIANDDNVHVEYDLIAANNPNSFLGAGLYRKMLDSFCGEDTLGNKVPDPNLGPADRYGVQFRPRQSFFVDRFLALQNYLERSNAILALYPISDSKPFFLLNSSEPEPTSASGQWDKRLATYAELTYQDLGQVPVGYRYLVASDSNNQGLWTIYTVVLELDGITKALLLTRVQNYDTKLYWDYINWIQPGYNATIKPVAEVPTFSDLVRLTVPDGASAKVTKNSFGKYEIYQYSSSNNTWTRVVLQDGTIRIKETIWDYAVGRFGFDVETFDAQRFDQYPAIETRQIIKAINEELFTGELLIYRNELLLLVFEFILTEQIAPDWLFKTSLIDVNHKIRELLPYQIFRQDNQDFVIDYIKEVKPYHVKIKEFNLKYSGLDTYQGTITDFDCPAYYDSAIGGFEAPALDDSEPPKYSNSEPSTAAIWQELPWNQWYQNYELEFDSAIVLDGGRGYTVAPQVTVTGDAETEARLVARVNSAGHVVELIVISQGSGYTTTPIITIEGGNGTGAKAVAVLKSTLVRSMLTTIKYDRYEYTSQVVDWEPNTKYTEGQLVRYENRVWSVNQVDDSTEMDSGSIFNPEQYTEVDSATLNAADRVIGLYTPDPNEPGRELAQVMLGIDYPGVQVMGPGFDQNTGFDVGNFDINPFDNIDYGPEGRPTYSESILDVIYESSFSDTYLGTRPSDINVDGGAFVDTYESHAPEELVPGITYDTLDFRVLTRPGADWEGNGHGFNIKSINLAYTTTDTTVSFAEVMAHAVAVKVSNVTNGVSLIPYEDYTVDWPNRTVRVLNAVDGDIIEVDVYGIGGGNQLFKESYPGQFVGNELVIPVITPVNWGTYTTYQQGAYVRYNGNVYRVNRTITSGSSFNPVLYTIIDAGTVLDTLLILVNGEIITNYNYAQYNGYETKISFNDTYDATDWVVVTALGATTPPKSWSYPLIEYFVYDGSTDVFTLTNSLQGTNDINVIVERNGQRLRPAESIEYFGDGSSAGPFYLPTRGNVPQGLIADNDVVVYVDGERQILAADYNVSVWDGSSDRYVQFVTAPAPGTQIIISVTTEADYSVNGDQLTLRVGAATNSVIAVTTWNDTQEQNILTQVFQGPTQSGTSVGQPYDSTNFDQGNVSFDPGSFDYGVGTVISTNEFDTGRVITNAQRVYVTLDGYRLFPGIDYEVSGTNVIIGGSIISPASIVAITSFTQYVVPEALSFRIFQDMLGFQRIYRITTDNTTVLTQAVDLDDDVLYLRDASHLSQPNPANNIFGQLTINGERMTYRYRDLVNNTVSGLRRGVAGTAVDTHAVGAAVIDIGQGDMLPQRYQQNLRKNVFYGDGNTQTYTTDIGFVNDIDVYLGGSVRCYLGPTVGTLVEIPQEDFSIVSVNPVTVQLNFIPDAGLQFRVTYTPTVGPVSTLTVPTTGATSRWAAPFDATDLVLQSTNDYTITDLNPITVEFDTPVPVKRVVVVNDLNSDTFFISQADVATTTFVTDISVTRPIQVKVGGSLVESSTYSVSSVNPIVITFFVAPSKGLEIEIYITQAKVLYAQGVGTASDGRPLQEQDTLAAWFIEGRV